MKHPRILIPLPSCGEVSTPKYAVNRVYLDAIVSAGGEPLCIARPSEERLRDLVSLVDGILIVGGDDIDPQQYGQKNSGHSKNVDFKRDEVELTLVHLALAKKIPLLGICRGMQVINVALGGSLYQDIGAEMENGVVHDHHHHDGKPVPRNYLAHTITFKKSTQLKMLTQRETLNVNSLHHQGIKILGENLVASAHAPDGLIEAIELPEHPFAIGVEWHPEELTDQTSKEIFQAFIDAANQNT